MPVLAGKDSTLFTYLLRKHFNKKYWRPGKIKLMPICLGRDKQVVKTSLAGAIRSKKKMTDFACYSFAVPNFDEQQTLWNDVQNDY